MKKKKTKKPERMSYDNAGLGDFGIEPPKIYRDSQRAAQQNPRSRQTQRSKPPLAKNEQRAKQTKKRKKRNKLRKVLVWLVIAFLFAAVAVVLSLTVFFHIESITVKGYETYSQEEILSQCTVDIGENLFLADTRKASAALEQNLPYIYSATFKKKLPSTLEITITESQPAYYIQNKDKTFILLDKSFKVLTCEAERGSGIAVTKAQIKSAVAGHKIEFENEDVSGCLQTMAQTIIDNNIGSITAIYSNNSNDNYLIYDNRITFKIGSCDDIENKIFQGLTSCEELDKSSPNAKGTMTIKGGKQIYFTEE